MPLAKRLSALGSHIEPELGEILAVLALAVDSESVHFTVEEDTQIDGGANSGR